MHAKFWKGSYSLTGSDHQPCRAFTIYFKRGWWDFILFDTGRFLFNRAEFSIDQCDECGEHKSNLNRTELGKWCPDGCAEADPMI